MKEEEMKTKECPKRLMMMTTLQIKAAEDGKDEEFLLKLGRFGLCSGSDCAIWSPEYETETIIIQKHEEIPSGWYLIRENTAGKTIRRLIATDSGDCGLKSKECGCSQ